MALWHIKADDDEWFDVPLERSSAYRFWESMGGVFDHSNHSTNIASISFDSITTGSETISLTELVNEKINLLANGGAEYHITGTLNQATKSNGDTYGWRCVPTVPSAIGSNGDSCWYGYWDANNNWHDALIDNYISDLTMEATRIQLAINNGSITGTDTYTGNVILQSTTNSNGDIVLETTNKLNLNYGDLTIKNNVVTGAYDSNKYIAMPRSGHIYLALYGQVWLPLDSFQLYGADGGTFTMRAVNLATQYTSGVYKYLFEVSGNGSERFSIDNSRLNNKNIIPLYLGEGNDISDEYRRFIGLDNTQDLQDRLDSKSQELAQSSNMINAQEDRQFDQMETASQNVQLNSSFITGNGFARAANYVRLRFQDLVLGNPFGDLIILVLGVGLFLSFMR